MNHVYAKPLRGLPAQAAVFFTSWLARAGAGVLLLLLALPLLGWGQAPSVGTILNPDGTVRAGASGAFDAKGYQLSYGKGGQPVLRTTASPDWSALGGGPAGTQTGVSNNVNAVALVGSTLYVGGNFDTAGGVPAGYIAKWDGTTWSSLGTGATNGVNSSVLALAVSGTTLYVGGYFTTAGSVATNGIAKWDGTSWSALGSGFINSNYGNNYPGSINALAVSGSTVYASGNFTTAGGVPAVNLAKWDGTSWSALGSGFTYNSYGNSYPGSINALAVSGPTLYVGGYFDTAGGVPANSLAKWDGTNWSALGSGLVNISYGNSYPASMTALAVSGSTVYASGGFTTAGGVAASGIAKWDGTSWSALGSGLTSSGYLSSATALLLSGSTVYASGGFTTAGGVAASGIAKWDGTSWSALGSGIFNRNVYSNNTALALSGSTLYVGGYFDQAGGLPVNFMAGYDVGSATTGWRGLGAGAPNGTNSSVAALVVSGTTLYVGGSFILAGGLVANGVAKWDGTSWSTLGSGFGYSSNGTSYPASISALAVSGSTVYASGNFTTAGGVPAVNLAKWNGTSWSALGSGSTFTYNSYGSISPGSISVMAMSGPTLYVGGYFDTVDGLPAGSLAKWDGTSWSALGGGFINNSYGSNDPGSINALAVSGSTVYASGNFTMVGNVAANNIAKWDGTSWSALGGSLTYSGYPGYIYALAVSGPTLYVGGYFDQAGGVVVNGIATWDGTSWSALGSGLFSGSSFGQPNRLLASGSILYVAGSFDKAGNVAAKNVAKWDGITWSALHTEIASSPQAMALSSSGLYVGGYFTQAGDVAANRVALYTAAATEAPLPVALTQFAATAESSTAVRLAWATASEKNSRAFEVERSADGVAFARIGTVAAAGTTATAHSYGLLDAALPTGTSALYYRLRQVDLDGTASYSPVRMVALGTGGVVLFPNPAHGAATLTGVAAGQAVQVLNAVGRLVATATADASGTAALALPAGLPGGVYVVRAGAQALRLTVE
jgi:hypothetical protein